MAHRRPDRLALTALAVAASVPVLIGCTGDGRDLPPAREPLPATTTTPPTSTAFLSDLPSVTAPPSTSPTSS